MFQIFGNLDISLDPHISDIWLGMFENICSKEEKEKVYSCDVKVVVEPGLFAQPGAFSSSLGANLAPIRKHFHINPKGFLHPNFALICSEKNHLGG